MKRREIEREGGEREIEREGERGREGGREGGREREREREREYVYLLVNSSLRRVEP